MRKRGNLLPVTAGDTAQRQNDADKPAIKDHLKKKKQVPKQRSTTTTILIGTVALYLAYRWLTQFIDFIYDYQHYNEKKSQTSKFPLLYDIPYIPSSNWPVFSRFFRPHNAHIVYNAKNALKEYGEDLRKLMERGKHPLTYDSHIHTKDDPDLRHWFHERAPWLMGNSESGDFPLNVLPRPIERKALVIAGGDKQLAYLKTLVHSIRHIHESYVGIRIVYRNDNDLSEKSRKEIQEVSDANIQFINLSQYFDLDLAKLSGWNLKPFGMLAVPETEVAVVDADVMLLQSPDHLFHQEGYKKTGALFYHDRVKPQFYWDVHTAAKWLQPDLSQRMLNMLSYGKTSSTSYHSEQIQEGGIVVLDKSRRMLGLWTMCLLFGRPDIRQYLQTDHMYGDKELYWMAMETIKEDYEFARYYPGVVGGTLTDFQASTTQLPMDASETTVREKRQEALTSNQALCGRLLHFDDDDKPLWVNGGYMLKEDDWFSSEDISQSAINPVMFIDGGDSTNEEFPNPWLPFWRNIVRWYTTLKGENQVWALHRSMGVECLAPNVREIQLVPQDSVDKGRQAVQFYFEQKRMEK